ncbi:MAG: hypothetical protein H0X65_01015 [Gemmatimonadetes bacterium]|nr:hypothetical protein [Gemmatimonadota bacterium]
MLKNRIIPIFAVAALVGAAACERQDETRVETPATETITPSPAVDPITTPGATMDPMDPMIHDDTLMMQGDTLMMRDPIVREPIL